MLAEIYSIYAQFLSFFPERLHWLVSLVLAGLLVYAVFQTIKRNFIWIILLVVLLPASLPILANIWKGVVDIIKYLLTRT
jgi:hypothetical protein